MEYLGLHYLALAAAGAATVVGTLQSRKARDTMAGRSARSYTRASAVLFAAIAIGIGVQNDAVIMIGATLAFLIIAIGLLIQGREAEVFTKLAGEQRVDFITKLPNARSFAERLAGEHSRTKRTGMRYAIAVFEIDDFHRLSADDKLNGMRLLAKSLEDSIRNTDALGRIGEGHIAVLMVDTAAEGGVIGCERARERFFFESCAHDPEVHVTRPLTVSVGIAAFDEDTIDPNDVVENSKLALQRLRGESGAGVRIYDRGDLTRRTSLIGQHAFSTAS